MWRVGPKERTDFSRHRDRLIDPESLQCLDIKNAIIKIARGALVPMNTLPLTKHLSSHDESPIPRAAEARTTEPFFICVGDLNNEGSKQAG